MRRFNVFFGDLGWVETCRALAVSSCVLIFAFALSSSNSQAQNSESDGEESSGESSLVIEEIVVTARKREQNYLDVPESITVITERILEREDINSLADFTIRVPGLTFDQVGIIGYRGAENINLRGVGGRANFYLDETPLPITDVRLFDVNRIEVLRGPQGTLYGDAAMGGTVKIVLNKPSVEDFEAAFNAGYSFTKDGAQSYSSEVLVNVPLSDRVALRLTGYFEDVGGYIDNVSAAPGLGDQTGGFIPFDVSVRKDANGGTRKGVRAAVRFEATQDLTIDLSGWLQNVSLGARSFYNQDTPLQTAFVGTQFEEQNFQLYNMAINWNHGSFDVVSSSTYYEVNTVNSEDITAFLSAILGFGGNIFSNPLQLNNSFPSEAFSHESRASFEGEFRGLPVYAVGGIFYQNRKTSRDQLWFDSQAITDINDQGVFPFDFGFLFDLNGIERGLWAFQVLPEETEELAFFGEISVEVAPKVEITAGLRYFEFDLSQTRIVDGFLFGGREESSGKTSDNGVNPRFGIKFDVSDEIIAYANAAKGFSIGSALGSALPSICDASLAELGLDDGPISPESLWSYEGGVKGRFLDNKLVIDAGGYYIDWSNIQETIRFDPTECPEGLLGNFGNAKIYGGEFTFTLAPTEGLRIAGSLGYSDVDRSRPAIGVNAAELVGNNILTTSLQAEYSFPISDTLDAYVGGDFQYIEEGKTDEPGTPHYSVSNIRMGFVSADIGWELALVGRNIFNSQPELVFFAAGSIGTLSPQSSTLRPRTIGAELRARF